VKSDGAAMSPAAPFSLGDLKVFRPLFLPDAGVQRFRFIFEQWTGWSSRLKLLPARGLSIFGFTGPLAPNLYRSAEKRAAAFVSGKA
jgi:hypothetical protein